MYVTEKNIKFSSCYDANEIADELFESLCSKHREILGMPMKESELTFYSVQLMYYKCHEVKF